ncbi:MAG: PAC2 family protein [Chloroflexi bacterium]|nr:PAC2 family protein [Chloroflexota bacterium]
MSSSRRKVAGMNDLLKFWGQPELKNPSLVVGWSVDAGKLGTKVTDYLNRKLGGQTFAEIEPVEFFPLGGAPIEDDLIQLPESKFYSCPGKDLIVFISNQPRYEWYQFLSLVLDAAQHYCPLKEIYIIGGMISPGAHSIPRELRSIFSSPEMKEVMSDYNLDGEFDFETPPGQRPALNSFLLWMAKKRKIPAVSLWVPIPFYLIAADDPTAERKVVELLNQRLALGIDLSDLDEEIRRQNELIAEMRNRLPDIDESISKLEGRVRLSEEESQNLVGEIEKLFRNRKG